MPRYVARPIEVEVARFDGTYESIAGFARHSYAFGNVEPDENWPGHRCVRVFTRRFLSLAREGDFVVGFPVVKDGIVIGYTFEVFAEAELEQRFDLVPE